MDYNDCLNIAVVDMSVYLQGHYYSVTAIMGNKPCQ